MSGCRDGCGPVRLISHVANWLGLLPELPFCNWSKNLTVISLLSYKYTFTPKGNNSYSYNNARVLLTSIASFDLTQTSLCKTWGCCSFCSAYFAMLNYAIMLLWVPCLILLRYNLPWLIRHPSSRRRPDPAMSQEKLFLRPVCASLCPSVRMKGHENCLEGLYNALYRGVPFKS
jgi:hypothetical protein